MMETTHNALGRQYLANKNVFSRSLKAALGGVRIADRVRNTVPVGRTSNGKSTAAVLKCCGYTCYIQCTVGYRGLTKHSATTSGKPSVGPGLNP